MSPLGRKFNFKRYDYAIYQKYFKLLYEDSDCGVGLGSW